MKEPSTLHVPTLYIYKELNTFNEETTENANNKSKIDPTDKNQNVIKTSPKSLTVDILRMHMDWLK